MTHHIALRDAARIVLPFSIFIGLFGHGAVSVASMTVAALCLWSELMTAPRAVPARSDAEGG